MGHDTVNGARHSRLFSWLQTAIFVAGVTLVVVEVRSLHNAVRDSAGKGRGVRTIQSGPWVSSGVAHTVTITAGEGDDPGKFVRDHKVDLDAMLSAFPRQ